MQQLTISMETIVTIFIILGIGILVYLIMILSNVYKLLKNINGLVEHNKSNINGTMDQLPEITTNITKVSGIVKDEMEVIQKVMDNVGKASDSAREVVDTVKNDIVLKAKNILDIIDAIKKFIESKSSKKSKEIVYKYKYSGKEKDPKEIIIKKPITNNDNEKPETENYEETVIENDEITYTNTEKEEEHNGK